MIINKDSWHYRFIKKMSDHAPSCYINNSCEYFSEFINSLIKAMFLLIATSLVGGSILFLTADCIAAIVAMIVYGVYLDSIGVIAFMSVALAGSVICLVYLWSTRDFSNIAIVNIIEAKAKKICIPVEFK